MKMQGISDIDSVGAVKTKLIELFESLWKKRSKRKEHNLNTSEQRKDNKGNLMEHHSCCYGGKFPKPVNIFQASKSKGFEDMSGYNTKFKRPLKFHIVNEFVTSERAYVERLELVCTDFRNFMTDRRESVKIANLEKVLQFNNLTDIYNLGKSLLDSLEVRLKTSI